LRESVRVFGRSTPVWLASFDPATSSWRTSQLSLLEDSIECLATLPRSGMTRNGIAYQQQPLAPLTSVTGSGLLPTPDTGESPNGHGRRGGRIGNGRQSGASLDAMAKSGLWPTPVGSVAQLGEKPETWLERRERVKAKGINGNGMGMPLTIAVQMWPTPTTQDASNDGGPSQFERNSLPLDAAVKAWPTPNARDYKGAPGAGARERGGHQSSLPGALKDSEGSGSLNPTWVEWLMGFPLGWTDLGASETRSSRRSRNGSATESSTTKKDG
jgi:hypothetical protein